MFSALTYQLNVKFVNKNVTMNTKALGFYKIYKLQSSKFLVLSMNIKCHF